MKKFVSVLLAFVMIIPIALMGGGATCSENDPDFASVKNVILFIGDGMGFEHVKAAEIYAGKPMVFDEFDFKTQSDTDNAWDEVTDSAAGATALSCGVRTLNGYLGKNEDGEDLKTIMDYSKDLGKLTGVVTSDYLTGATPSGFSAHSNDRNDSYQIINTQAEGGVDFLAGDYSENYITNKLKFTKQGYEFYDSLDNIDPNKKALIMGEVEPVAGQTEDGTPYMMLDEMVDAAIDYLSRDEDGFTLMVEGAYIDKCSHGNDGEGMVKNLVAFNKAVKKAVEFASDRTDTVIIITADHETGGLTVGSGATKDKMINGNFDDLNWTTGSHTGARVPVFVRAAQNLEPMLFSTSGDKGYLNNKDIFLYMLSCVKGERVNKVESPDDY